MIIKFGQHKGLSLTQVPKDYLRYLLTQEWLKRDLRDAIEQTINGTYVSPVPVPKREPYDPKKYLPKPLDTDLAKAKKDGASQALQLVLKAFVKLNLDDATNAKVIGAIYEVAQSFA